MPLRASIVIISGMIHVLLVQLPVPNNPATNIPLAAGYLKAYAQAQGLLQHVTIDILPRHIADNAGDALLVTEIIARAPDVLGFSLYTWNSERSLEIARRVKEQLPQVLVIGGGPEVQPDNNWLIHHPGLDMGVVGEGEQTFVDVLRRLTNWPTLSDEPSACATYVDIASFSDTLPGLIYRNNGAIIVTLARATLDDLMVVPSPYSAGFLELLPDGMALIEVSRWCPYACSFCLYGRKMDAKLGRRYFELERVLTEIAWAKDQGVTAIHFVEANLNLIPFFRPLMNALEEFNADGALALYAELRGEHLSEETVASMVRAGLRVAEVGLQTANPVALAASRRRTNLAKWAAGTRALLNYGVEVLLDVIVGLPEDDTNGVYKTLDFIEREALGAYDIFMLQLLPGTTVRAQAEHFGITYQPHPPYYILSTNRMDYSTLRRIRNELKLGVGVDPNAIEGMPEPHHDALQIIDHPSNLSAAVHTRMPIQRLCLWADTHINAQVNPALKDQLACHVDIIASWEEKTPIPSRCSIARLHSIQTAQLASLIAANPNAIFDLYLFCSAPPDIDALRTWRDALPYKPGYLDRVAVYLNLAPELGYYRVSPRIWLVFPWIAQVEVSDFAPLAQIIWHYELEPDAPPPLGAWRSAGGAGIWVPGATPAQIRDWAEATGLYFWL